MYLYSLGFGAQHVFNDVWRGGFLHNITATQSYTMRQASLNDHAVHFPVLVASDHVGGGITMSSGTWWFIVLLLRPQPSAYTHAAAVLSPIHIYPPLQRL